MLSGVMTHALNLQESPIPDGLSVIYEVCVVSNTDML